MFKQEQPWKVLREHVIHAGRRRIVERELRREPDGEIVHFEIKEEKASVCILALTPQEEVILVRQFRVGPNKYLLELPGGGSEDQDPSPAVAAARELLEETGHQGELSFLGQSFACAYSTRVIHHFLAQNCVEVCQPLADPNEPLEVVKLSLEEFIIHLQTGDLTDSDTAFRGLWHLGVSPQIFSESSPSFV